MAIWPATEFQGEIVPSAPCDSNFGVPRTPEAQRSFGIYAQPCEATGPEDLLMVYGGTPQSENWDGRSSIVSNTSSSVVSTDDKMSTAGSRRSSSSTFFDEEEFLRGIPERDTEHERVFFTRFPFPAAHRYCRHDQEDHKACPRCYRVCIREHEMSDAVICTWCFSEGAADDICWFCWRCGIATGSHGQNNQHYSLMKCWKAIR